MKHDPFGIDSDDPLPDYDGPDYDTDEVENAMLADMVENADAYEKEFEAEEERASRASTSWMTPRMWFGALAMAIGAGLTAISYADAEPGGDYTVFTGLFVVGAAMIVTGAFGRKQDG